MFCRFADDETNIKTHYKCRKCFCIIILVLSKIFSLFVFFFFFYFRFVIFLFCFCFVYYFYAGCVVCCVRKRKLFAFKNSVYSRFAMLSMSEGFMYTCVRQMLFNILSTQAEERWNCKRLLCAFFFLSFHFEVGKRHVQFRFVWSQCMFAQNTMKLKDFGLYARFDITPFRVYLHEKGQHIGWFGIDCGAAIVMCVCLNFECSLNFEAVRY